MLFVPGPRGGHDVFQLRKYWLPTQLANGFSADATSCGGSPGRRGFSTVEIFLPVIFLQTWITCQTRKAATTGNDLPS